MGWVGSARKLVISMTGREKSMCAGGDGKSACEASTRGSKQTHSTQIPRTNCSLSHRPRVRVGVSVTNDENSCHGRSRLRLVP